MCCLTIAHIWGYVAEEPIDHYKIGTKHWVRFNINCLKYSECLKFYYLFLPVLFISAT